ncbi:MAG TPA: DUF6266 family protein [Pedobacter sp.]|uniref:DUF6266 family protein n=1 Tax=Pedobacter sp. TaxID=1411316 RepID=UPI002C01A32E|nr:DUF6266 family protein [Pedobacter sp.]HMI05825.1 DUF6266 family protein [Pedobacter sp.]
MARIKNGILGAFSGKAGAVVGYMIGDEAYMRGLPRKKTYTDAERLNQKKFKLVQDYLEDLKDLLRVGFKNYYTKTGGFRAAVAYTRKMALVSDDAGFYIDPALFRFSGGDLPVAVDPAVTLVEPLQMRIDWNAADLPYQIKSDQLMLLIYDTVEYKSKSLILDGPFRKDGTLTIDLPNYFKGKELDVYIGFVAADRSRQSDSQYLGRFSVPG